jgi:hypothetical protein
MGIRSASSWIYIILYSRRNIIIQSLAQIDETLTNSSIQDLLTESLIKNLLATNQLILVTIIAPKF